MDIQEFFKDFVTNSDKSGALKKIDTNSGWPKDTVSIQKIYDFLLKQEVFSTITCDYIDLYYKIYQSKIISSETFFSHIFHQILIFKDSHKSIPIRPINNIGSILDIAGQALAQDDFTSFVNILEEGVSYAKHFYSNDNHFFKDFALAIEMSQFKNLTSKSNVQNELNTYIDTKCSQEDKIGYILLMTFVFHNFSKIKTHDIYLKNQNKNSFIEFFLNHPNLLKPLNNNEPFTLDESSTLVLDTLLVGLKNNKAEEVLNCLFQLDKCPCIFSQIIIEAPLYYSKKILHFAINRGVFSNNTSTNIEAIKLLMFLKNETREDDIFEVVVSHPDFPRYMKTNNVPSNIIELNFPTYEERQSSFKNLPNAIKAIPGLEFLCFLRNGFTPNTLNLNKSLLEYFYEVLDSSTNELNSFFIDFEKSNLIPSIKSMLEDEKTNYPTDVYGNMFKKIDSLIFALELNNYVPIQKNNKQNTPKF